MRLSLTSHSLQTEGGERWGFVCGWNWTGSLGEYRGEVEWNSEQVWQWGWKQGDGDGWRQWENAGEKKEQSMKNLGAYGRQEGQNHLKLRTRLTSLIDEKMLKCIWEPLFALVPTDMTTKWDHLSKEFLLSLLWLSVSLTLPWVLYHGQATWILSKDEAKLVCKLSMSDIKTQLKPQEYKECKRRNMQTPLKSGSNVHPGMNIHHFGWEVYSTVNHHKILHNYSPCFELTMMLSWFCTYPMAFSF